MDFHSLCRWTRSLGDHTGHVCCLGAPLPCSGVKLAHHGRQTAHATNEENQISSRETYTDLTHLQTVMRGQSILLPACGRHYTHIASQAVNSVHINLNRP